MWQIATSDVFPKAMFRNLYSSTNLTLVASQITTKHYLQKDFIFFLETKADFGISYILKEIGYSATFSRQSVKQYFGTPLPVRIVSLHHK